MRVIVCGSREFYDQNLVFRTLDRLFSKVNKKKLIILSGGARGADKFGEIWCFQRMVSYEVFHANWERYGKAAGHIRNTEMLEAAPDALVAFWNGKSLGTADMLTKARKIKGLKIRLIMFKEKT